MTRDMDRLRLMRQGVHPRTVWNPAPEEVAKQSMVIIDQSSINPMEGSTTFGP